MHLFVVTLCVVLMAYNVAPRAETLATQVGSNEDGVLTFEEAMELTTPLSLVPTPGNRPLLTNP